ncbi:14677_t:CDS:1 [Acaulospora colombiana]|uniref:14677_t:CDS:1 n=1 Tax=Acaulospora colombiana TaxID=27376 RepID=A0ACA9NEE0_9GLOM|nr:14677_t:CDS:1 [Acaulospora colombiana]
MGDNNKEFRKDLYDIIIKQISRNNEVKTAHKCIETLCRVVTNILDDPNDERKRKLKETTNTFQSTIRGAQGGVEFLVRLGFRSRVINFEKFYVLELSITEDSPDMEKLKVAQELLADFLKKVKERAELVSNMQAKEKIAEELQKKAVLEKIEEDRENRAAARERLKTRRQHQKETQIVDEESNSTSTNDQPLQPEQFYKTYHHSHYRQHDHEEQDEL